MGERASYTPGTFNWVDLATTDADAAKAFYGGLFGWEFEDMDAGEGRTYSQAKLDGKEVAAVYAAEEDGAPPRWSSYVSVQDVDALAPRAAELGGAVAKAPFDVLDVGRMAVIQDPTGAAIALWQPKAGIGARLVNAAGAFSWNELATRDQPAAKAFYEALLGWRAEAMENGGGYEIVFNGERPNGGMRTITEAEADLAPHWAVYFTVADADASAAKVRELGGAVAAGPEALEMGRYVAARDPQGAGFLLFEGEPDD